MSKQSLEYLQMLMDLHREWKVTLSEYRAKLKHGEFNPILRRMLRYEIVQLCMELKQIESQLMSFIDQQYLRLVQREVVTIQR